ncbi:hypothetical protein KFZ56_05585 [Virgibacillus sp. NKC19-3]|uniref:hypothetical protein n=1 Tax=Virgibacillus saliphilus TaxID=2831674 RepID=UPI001C9AF809|nr:hypothetical protein [Virgibacillus sp. NKC19-3]MBY7142557.1 hypothetical protein [Virgibacillus sp. NKC19-3]
MNWLGIILVPLFLVALYIILKFTWGEEGKDERGAQVLSKSYMASMPILPIGWLILELIQDSIGMSYDNYRYWIWILVLAIFIVQGAVIAVYRLKV